MHSGGPDGELGASLRYLSQRYAMPYPAVQALLTDIGTEELGHLEMIAAIVHQLTRNLTDDRSRITLGLPPTLWTTRRGFIPRQPRDSPGRLLHWGKGRSHL